MTRQERVIIDTLRNGRARDYYFAINYIMRGSGRNSLACRLTSDRGRSRHRCLFQATTHPPVDGYTRRHYVQHFIGQRRTTAAATPWRYPPFEHPCRLRSNGSSSSRRDKPGARSIGRRDVCRRGWYSSDSYSLDGVPRSRRRDVCRATRH